MNNQVKYFELLENELEVIEGLMTTRKELERYSKLSNQGQAYYSNNIKNCIDYIEKLQNRLIEIESDLKKCIGGELK